VNLKIVQTVTCRGFGGVLISDFLNKEIEDQEGWEIKKLVMFNEVVFSLGRRFGCLGRGSYGSFCLMSLLLRSRTFIFVKKNEYCHESYFKI